MQKKIHRISPMDLLCDFTIGIEPMGWALVCYPLRVFLRYAFGHSATLLSQINEMIFD